MTESAGRPALGPFTLAGLAGMSSLDLIRQVKEGLPAEMVEDLQEETRLPAKLLHEVTQISESTLARRRRALRETRGRGKAKGPPPAARLDQQQSERVLRLILLWKRAVDLFQGDKDRAREWLLRENRALGGRAPLSLADTEIGAREVEAVIDRLESGVF